MYIPGPAINITGSPRFISRKLFADDSRIKRKPPKSTTEDESTPGLLCWGVAGQMPTPERVPTVSFEVTETDRETTPVRIENPDDPNQYVDVLQTNKMKLNVPVPQEKNNSSTADADIHSLDVAGTGTFQKQTESTDSTRDYTITFKPPERAV